MKRKFWFHKGGYRNSMETEIQVESREELLQKINDHYAPFLFATEIEISETGRFDDRDGNTKYLVSVKYKDYHPEDFCAVGHISGLLI